MEGCAVRKFVMLRKKGDPTSSPVPIAIEFSEGDLRTVNKTVTFANATPEVCVLIVCLKPRIVPLGWDDSAPEDLADLESVNIRIGRDQLISLEVESPKSLYLSDIVDRPYPGMIQKDVIMGDEFKASLSRDPDLQEALKKRFDKALCKRLLDEI